LYYIKIEDADPAKPENSKTCRTALWVQVFMKRIISLIASIAVIGALAFWYLSLGKKAAVESKVYMEDAKGRIDDAKKAMEDLNKAAEESKKAIEQAVGK
jgi:hypothetical protein